MSFRWPRVFRSFLLTLLGLMLLAAIAVGAFFGLPLLKPAAGAAERSPSVSDAEPGVRLVDNQTDAIAVPRPVADRLKIQTAPVADARPRLLELRGSLTFDPQELARIKSRFGGEVIEIAQLRDPLASQEKGQSVLRTLRPGDCVKKGDRLAVLWSKELGETKSALVDALSQLYLDQETLKRFEKSGEVIPEQRVLEQRRQVENDFIAADKARRTLQTYRLTDEEIKDIEAEARRIRDRGGERDSQRKKDWPRVDIISRIDGVIAEKNVVIGDYVPDSSFDLFKVANIDRLAVWAHAYEEDLPALQAYEKQLHEQGRALPWKIRLRDNAGFVPVEGTVTRIGLVVDPVQHSIIVEGTVDNKDHHLRAGENITATIALPPAAGEVSISIGALVEDGKESVVFVQTSQGQFSM